MQAFSKNNLTMKSTVDWPKLWQGIRKYLLNKYIVTLLAFAFVVAFVGDQSLYNRIERAIQIRHLEQQRDDYRQGIEAAKHELELLQNKDSLERYAREHYYMHTENEDVYVVKD